MQIFGLSILNIRHVIEENLKPHLILTQSSKDNVR